MPNKAAQERGNISLTRLPSRSVSWLASCPHLNKRNYFGNFVGRFCWKKPANLMNQQNWVS